MQIATMTRRTLRRVLDLATLAGGVVLLVAVSWEIIADTHRQFSSTYMVVQFVVCVLFLFDFFVRLAASTRRVRFFVRNGWFFLISVPYLNLIGWMALPHDVAMLIGIMPLLRAFLALYVVIRWFIINRIRRLFVAYLCTVVLFTYLSALVFYDYEVLVNPQLHGFGNALWWAWMNITTVGAAIDPVTTIGKVICVLLPILGMMMFPIFTSYILSFYQHPKR